MQNTNQESLGTSLLKFGAVIFGAAILSEVLRDFTTEKDTVNYTLKHKGKKVYHGIAYEDRLDRRLYEHECTGKKFDDCIYDYPKSRRIAMDLEAKRIQRDRPKYNKHHNS